METKSTFTSKKLKQQFFLISSWFVAILSVGVSLSLLICFFLAPHALLPLLIINLLLNLTKVGLTMKLLGQQQNKSSFDKQLCVFSGLGIGLFLASKFALPTMGPASMLGIAGLLVITDGIRLVKDIVKIVRAQKNLSKIKGDKNSTVEQLQVEKLKDSIIQRSIKISFSLATIALGVASIFFPPLLFAAFIVAGIGTITYKISKTVSEKKLDLLEQKIKANEGIISSEKQEIHPNYDLTQNTKQNQQQLSNEEKLYPQKNERIEKPQKENQKTTLAAMRRVSSITHPPCIYKSINKSKSIPLFEDQKINPVIKHEITKLFPKGSMIINNKTYLTIKSKDNMVAIFEGHIETNAVENQKFLSQITSLLKHIGWSEVEVPKNQHITSSIVHDTLINTARSNGLIVKSDDNTSPTSELNNRII